MEATQLLCTRERTLKGKQEISVHSSTSCQPAKWNKLNARMVVKQLQQPKVSTATLRPPGKAHGLA
jgi:hypothetical protein